MTWAPTETQKTIYTLLGADSALTALLGANKIFDHVPDNAAYPFVKLRIKPWTDRGNHTLEGLSCELQIDVWYQAPNRGDLKVQLIQKRIDELLHSVNIEIDGWNVISLRRAFIDVLTEPDNVTLHGVQKFNLMIGEA